MVEPGRLGCAVTPAITPEARQDPQTARARPGHPAAPGRVGWDTDSRARVTVA